MRRLLLTSLFASLIFAHSRVPSGAQSPAEPVAGEPAPTASPAPAPAPAPAAPAPPAPAAGTKISYSSCNVEGDYVALTFDDGPHPQNTPRLLDILKERGIKATFFVVGQNATDHPDILRRIVEEGHELANHSFTHPTLASLGETDLRGQLDRTHQAVLKATGVAMKIMRPPYGALTETQRRWTHSTFGYRVILWDVDPLDWKYRDAARVEGEILNRTKAGSIILSHDIHKTTVDAMPTTLDALVAKGFKFVTVSDLLAKDRPSAPKPSVPQNTAAPSAKAEAKTEAKPDPSKDSKKETKKETKADSKPREDAPAKKTAAESKDSRDSKPAPAKKDAPSAPGETAKKPSTWSVEELKKKWQQSMNQR